MSIEEKTPQSSGEPSKRPWLLKRQLDKHWWIQVVLGSVLMQTILWAFFLISVRSNALSTIAIAIAIISVFTLVSQVTYITALAARRRVADRTYRLSVTIMVANAFALIIGQFSTVYWLIGTKANFSVDLSHVDAIYFTLGTLTTAGTGTIAPTSDLSRALVSGQMVLDLVFIAVVVTIAVTRWSEKSD